MPYCVIYLGAIVAINAGFAHLPIWSVFSAPVPAMSFFAGTVFVLRDLAQRRVGHRVLFVMLAGAAVSFALASPTIAIASALAFAFSETLDWLIYSRFPASPRARILASSAVAVPVDTYLFLALAFDDASLVAVVIMSAIKMLAALATFLLWAR